MKDNIKNFLGWALIVLALVSAFAALSYVFTYQKSVPVVNSFGVSGEGKVVIVPDVAQFGFSVVTEGGVDIAKLQAENTTKVNQAIAYLKGRGINNKDIKTASYNLSPRYDNCYSTTNRQCPPPSIVGYMINQSVSVKIRDFDLIGEVLTGVVESGANSVSSLDFTVDDPEAARAEAREEAIKLAQEKAKAIARAGGFSIGRLVSIEEDGYYPVPYYGNKLMGMGGAEAAMDMAVAPTIEPGSEDVVVTVNLRYEIK